MSDPAIDAARLADLRRRAASRLTGSASEKGAPARITDALSALHALASSPQTAADALALLHELQVHQVEIDLQAEELRESRAELEAALRRQSQLYDSQPVGCFTIDVRLVVQELNQTGATMLGIEREDGHGVDLGQFLTAGSRITLLALVARAVANESRVAGALKLSRGAAAEFAVQVNVRAEASANRCFVVLSDPGDGREEGVRSR